MWNWKCPAKLRSRNEFLSYILGSSLGDNRLWDLASFSGKTGFFWGGRRELNPQPSEPQSDALPIELLPPQTIIVTIGL